MTAVRLATQNDGPVIGRLLHDFNREFEEPDTPEADWLAQRVARLIHDGDTEVLLVEEPPAGLAVLRYQPAIWTGGLEAYLAELYVIPARRGQGLGRALMEAVIDHARGRGSDYILVGTSEADVAARALYERMGFTDRERGPGGPLMIMYERGL